MFSFALESRQGHCPSAYENHQQRRERVHVPNVGSHYHYGPCFFFRLPPPKTKTAPKDYHTFYAYMFGLKTLSLHQQLPQPITTLPKEQLFKQLTSPETNRWTVKLRSRISFKGTQVTQVIRWGSEHRLVQSCLWRASIIVHAAQAFDLSIQLGWFLMVFGWQVLWCLWHWVKLVKMWTLACSWLFV